MRIFYKVFGGPWIAIQTLTLFSHLEPSWWMKLINCWIFFSFFLQGNVLQVWKVFTTLSASSRARARRAKILEIEDWEAGFSFSSYRIMKQTFLRRTVASKTSCSSLGTVFKIENKIASKNFHIPQHSAPLMFLT